MWTITAIDNYIIFDNSSNQWTAKKAYISMEVSGNYVIVRWHTLENGNRFSRRELRLDYTQVSTPSSVSATDLYNQLLAMLTGTTLTIPDIQVNVTTADYTNNTATLTDVTNASFTVESGETYYFEFSGNMQSANASGLRLGISVPATTTVVYELWGNNSASSNFQSRAASYTGGEIAQTICAVASTRLGFRIFGTVIAGADGTVTLQGRIAGTGYTITLYSGLRTFAIKK